MHKHPLLLLIFLIYSTQGIAQETRQRVEPKPFYPPIPEIPVTTYTDKETQGITTISSSSFAFSNSTPSPEITQANFLQDIPVNVYTGTAITQLPILTVAEADLSLSLFLNYEVSGIKAHQVSGRTGLGWDIGGIPTLTRIIRGLPDEGKRELTGGGASSYTARKGFYVYGTDVLINPSTTDNDTESDWYFLNTGSGTFKFMFDAYQRPHFFPDADIKVDVEYINETTLDNIVKYFTKFTFTLPSGSKLTFAPPYSGGLELREVSCETEASFAQSGTLFSSGYYAANKVVSGWPITKMESPYGHEFTFSYESSKYAFYKLAENELSSACGTPTKEINKVLIESPRLIEINTKHTKVQFTATGTREDLDDFYSTIPLNESTNAPKLSEIKIIDKQNPSNPLVWSLNYSYFLGIPDTYYDLPTGYTHSQIGQTHRKRLKLQNVISPDSTAYSFTYHGEDVSLAKTRFSFGVDHWGYFNGKEFNYTYGFIASDTVTTCGSNRETNKDFMLYGALIKIESSLGAETIYEYEPNRASNYGSGNTDIAGVRIKKIRSKDLVRGTDIVKEYNYLTNSGASSGFLYLKPIYHIRRFDSPSTTEQFSNSSIYPSLLSESARAIVGYSYVKERIYDYANNLNLGGSNFSFHQNETEGTIEREQFFPNPSYGLVKLYLPEIFHPDHDFESGSLLYTETVNDNDVVLSKNKTTFTANNGLKTDSTYARKIVKIGGSTSYQNYYQLYKKYRAEETESIMYSQDGSGTPLSQKTFLTYKDEMPASYKNTYPGKHNNLVKTETTDSYGYPLVSITKYSADFDFDVDSTEICNPNCPIGAPKPGGGVYSCDDAICKLWLVTEHVPASGTDARAIYEMQQAHILYSPIEIQTLRNNKTVSAQYQTYYSNNSSFNTLPKASFGLRKMPKSNFSEVTFDINTDQMINDSDYGSQVGQVIDYNSYGFVKETATQYGSSSITEFDTSGVLVTKSKANAGINDELETQYLYAKKYEGLSKVTGANQLETKYEYNSDDARLRIIRNKDNEILERYSYNLNLEETSASSLVWDVGRNTCNNPDGSVVDFLVYVTGIGSGATVEFSIDGTNWYPANVSVDGYQIGVPYSGGGSQTFWARPSDNLVGGIISGSIEKCAYVGSSISWDNDLRTKDCQTSGQIKLAVYATGFINGATAEFSTDGGSSWNASNNSINGYEYSLTPGNAYETILARATDMPAIEISTQYHASCTSSINWSTNSCTANGSNSDFFVSVTGLATDSYAEFSIDGTTWSKANAGNNGWNVGVPYGSGGLQGFYARPAENPSIQIFGSILRCN